jgi:hypothetical protein
MSCLVRPPSAPRRTVVRPNAGHGTLRAGMAFDPRGKIDSVPIARTRFVEAWLAR